MSETSKVIWSEGMFLRPQHLQQYDRYIENLVNGRCLGLRPYAWGFSALSIDHNLLKIGKLALKECRGVFADGTPFCLPEDDALPLPIDIPENIQNEMVYLALPVRRSGGVEADSEVNADSLARFRVCEREVKDCNCGADGRVPVQIGDLKVRLLLQREERSGFTCLGVGRIVEMRADKSIDLDTGHIPPNLNCSAMPGLSGFLRELHGLFSTRGEMLVRELARPTGGGVAEIIDFLLLQLINRYQPLFRHLSSVEGLHPEDFYRIGVQLAGELATFFQDEKRAGNFPVYNHDDLQSSFFPLMEELRDLLARDRMRRAVQIPLNNPRPGVFGARLPDVHLLDCAIFVLAASAQVPAEIMRSNLPPQVTIGPLEEIQQLVRSQLRGIPIEPLPVAPTEIPFHVGFTYFELNRQCEHWIKMKESGGFVFWIGGTFPGLKLEFWAIRES